MDALLAQTQAELAAREAAIRAPGGSGSTDRTHRRLVAVGLLGWELAQLRRLLDSGRALRRVETSAR